MPGGSQLLNAPWQSITCLCQCQASSGAHEEAMAAAGRWLVRNNSSAPVPWSTDMAFKARLAMAWTHSNRASATQIQPAHKH